MSLFLDTRGLSTVAIGICDRCKMKVPLARMRSDGNSPGLRVCDKPGCWDHFDPWRLPARRPEDITLRFPRPEESLVPEPPISIFQKIGVASDSLPFSDSAVTEPEFGTYLLLNATESVTDDSSAFNRAVTATSFNFANPVLDGDIGGAQAYTYARTSSPGPAAYLGATAAPWMASLLESVEMCVEFDIKPLNIPGAVTAAGASRFFECMGMELTWRHTVDGSLRLVINDDSAPFEDVSITSAAAALSIGTETHVAVIIDKTTTAEETAVRLFIDGVQAVAATGLSAGYSLSEGLSRVGFGTLAANNGTALFDLLVSGLKITYGSRLYLTNTVGQPVNSFTPSALPRAA